MRYAGWLKKNLFAVVLVAAALVDPLILRTSFLRHLSIMVLIWATLGTAWNMLVGYAGQVSLGHGLFFGIGAYTTTLLFVKIGVPPSIGILAGPILAATVAYLMGLPLFRLSGFYFSIATIASAEIGWILFTNWDWAGGARGLFVPLKGDSLVHLQFTTKVPYYYLALLLFGLSVYAAHRLASSRAGYYFRAIRDDPEAAVSLGINIRKFKAVAYTFSAAITALAGGFYANYVLYIDPDSMMAAKFSTQICLLTVLGGVGDMWGPLIGASVLIPLSETTRVFLSGRGRAVDLLVYGSLIVAFAVFQPKGLIGLTRDVLTRARRAMAPATAAIATVEKPPSAPQDTGQGGMI